MGIAGELCIYTNSNLTIEDSETVAIFLPERTATSVRALTPREIVAELDKHVIGQAKAKRAVAIALRNRTRVSCCPRTSPRRSRRRTS